MNIILRQDMSNLGSMGDIVKVKPGYARNYLLPKGYAVEASLKNVRALEHEKRIIAHRVEKLRVAARSVAEKIAAVSLSFTVKAGAEDKLFGSITSRDIADALNEKGIEVDRRKISIAEPIKRLGSHDVEVKLGHDVTATVKITVEAEGVTGSPEAASDDSAAQSA